MPRQQIDRTRNKNTNNNNTTHNISPTDTSTKLNNNTTTQVESAVTSLSSELFPATAGETLELLYRK